MDRFLRLILATVLFLVALNALGGAIYGLTGARDIPRSWLKGSPFTSYFIPSLALLLLIAIPFLLAGARVLRRHALAMRTALVCVALLTIWIGVQVSMIGYVSWLQPAMLGAAALIFSLTFLLRRYEN